MSQKVQLNTRVSSTLATRVRADARKHSKSIDSIVEAVISHFYTGTSNEGKKLLFSTLPDKRSNGVTKTGSTRKG